MNFRMSWNTIAQDSILNVMSNILSTQGEKGG